MQILEKDFLQGCWINGSDSKGKARRPLVAEPHITSPTRVPAITPCAPRQLQILVYLTPKEWT